MFRFIKYSRERTSKVFNTVKSYRCFEKCTRIFYLSDGWDRIKINFKIMLDVANSYFKILRTTFYWSILHQSDCNYKQDKFYLQFFTIIWHLLLRTTSFLYLTFYFFLWWIHYNLLHYCLNRSIILKSVAKILFTSTFFQNYLFSV